MAATSDIEHHGAEKAGKKNCLTESAILFESFRIEEHYFLDEGGLEGAEYCIAVPRFAPNLEPGKPEARDDHDDRQGSDDELMRQSVSLLDHTPIPRPRGVLIHCHGCRPEGIEKTADLDLSDPSYLTLMKSGFIVAMTSYRREGRIVMEAIEDVKLLRDLILVKHVFPHFPMQSDDASASTDSVGRINFLHQRFGFSIILEGVSMGGHISTLIAETEDQGFHGVVTVGAALMPKGEEQTLDFSNRPHIPVLHLVTISEPTAVSRYSERCAEEAQHPPFQSTSALKILSPVVWLVSRPGHCNMNWRERITAIRALLAWIGTGGGEEVSHVPTMFKDVTDVGPPRQSVAVFDNSEQPAKGGAWGSIVTADVYGDCLLDFLARDLELLQVNRQMKLTLEIERTPRIVKTVVAFRGHSGDSFDVNIPQGAWMLYENADQKMVLCANGSVISPTNAAQFFRAHRGMRIHIESFQPPRLARLDLKSRFEALFGPK